MKTDFEFDWKSKVPDFKIYIRISESIAPSVGSYRIIFFLFIILKKFIPRKFNFVGFKCALH